MIWLGIDPGKTGAMVILFEDNSTEVYRVPTSNKGKDISWSLWARRWTMAIDLASPDAGVIESVGSMPKQGVSSTFKFGEALGFAHGIVSSTASIPLHWPTPSVWKRKMGLIGADKDGSIEEAARLLPSLRPEITRKKDDGVAEAGLLALYGRLHCSS